jgi:GTP-binding protein
VTAELPIAGHDCGSCVLNQTVLGQPGRRQALGTDTRDAERVVALAGNPNSGKSTLFNTLTGLRQRVGNWSGTTVSRAEGAYRHGGHVYRVVDLPGTTTLHSAGGEEQVASEFLLYAEPDVTVVVVDATRLERSLYLVLQLLQITRHVVVALNMIDEAERAGIAIDVRHLVRELGVPVVPMAARTGRGVDDLLGSIEAVAGGPAPDGRPAGRFGALAEKAATAVAADLVRVFPRLPHSRWFALRLLEGDPWAENAVRSGHLPVR